MEDIGEILIEFWRTLLCLIAAAIVIFLVADGIPEPEEYVRAGIIGFVGLVLGIAWDYSAAAAGWKKPRKKKKGQGAPLP